MKKKLYLYLVPAAVLLSVALILSLVCPYYEGEIRNQLKRQASLMAGGIERYGADYLDQLDPGGNPATLIGSDGTILYGEGSGSQNELIDAFHEGKTELSYYRDFWNEQILAVSETLSDGSVLWLCSGQYSVYALIKSLLQPILVVLAITLGAGLIIVRFVPERTKAGAGY